MTETPDPLTLWRPSDEVREAAVLTRYQRLLGRFDAAGLNTLEQYGELWAWSVTNQDDFWRSLWSFGNLTFEGSIEAALVDRTMPGAQWFPDVRVNFAEQILERDIDADAPALIAVTESDDEYRVITWGDFRRAVAVAQEHLRELGVMAGDRVAGYMPNVPETIIACLATVSLGATWTCCSSELGVAAAIDRLGQVAPLVLIGSTGYRYAGSLIERSTALAAIRDSLPSVTGLIVVPYEGLVDCDGPHDVWRDDSWSAGPLTYERVAFDHPLWVLYTSGTTGKPKALVHSQGGITLAAVAGMHLQMDLRDDDRFFFYSTPGWVVWNMVTAALMFCESVVLYEGSPTWPDANALWRTAAESETTYLGVSGALLAAAYQRHARPGDDHDLSRVRALCFGGSSIPDDAFSWVYDAVGPDVWFSSLSGGTEFGVLYLLAGSPTLPVRRGEFQCIGLGVDLDSFDDAGRPVVDAPGELVVKSPVPSMPVRLWGDDEYTRYRDSYFSTFPGVWRHGDSIRIARNGGPVLLGRSDATVNRNGVRIGTAEIYRAVEGMPAVLDSLVVDVSTPTRPRLILLVVLTDGELDGAVTGELKEAIRCNASPRHVPDEIVAVDAIPRTINGKKLEVPVKRILMGMPIEEAVDISSVADVAALEAVARLRLDATSGTRTGAE